MESLAGTGRFSKKLLPDSLPNDTIINLRFRPGALGTTSRISREAAPSDDNRVAGVVEGVDHAHISMPQPVGAFDTNTLGFMMGGHGSLAQDWAGWG